MTARQHKTRYNKTWQCESLYDEAGPGSPVGGIKSQEQSKESEIDPLPPLGVSKEHPANSHDLCRGPGVDPHNPHA